MFKTTGKEFCLISLLLLLATVLSGQDLETLGKQKPVTFNGSLQARGIAYTASGIESRRAPFTYLFLGNASMNFYSITVPFSFTFSEQDGGNFSQSFNQFGLSPYYKWIKVHAGYRNITFSPYTLAGHTILGGGVELTPGKFRFGYMYGRLSKAITLDTATQSIVPYSFSRKAHAVKIGVGSDKTFVELSGLYAKDDPNSIPFQQYNDMDVLPFTPPASNVVGSLVSKVQLSKKFFLEADIGTSLYTRDIDFPINLDSAGGSSLGFLGFLPDINASTKITTAARGAFGFQAKKAGVKLEYERIDPDFTSMGAYFFNNDLERISIAPNFSLAKGKVRFSGSLGLQHDNVLKQKLATAQRVIGSGNLNVDITQKLGFTANYVNFSNNQQPVVVRYADSLTIAQTTQTISFSPRYILASEKSSQVFLVSTNFMRLNDYSTYFENSSPSRDIAFNQYMANYIYTYNPLSLSVSVNLSHTDAEAAGQKSQNTGGTLSLSKSFFKNALSANASLGYIKSKTAFSSADVINSSGRLSYTFKQKHNLGLQAYYTNNLPDNAQNISPQFTELRAELAYTYTF